MPKLHHLRDFIAIASSRSVHSAARRLGMAQPVLTRSLQELEREVGVTLFERHARGVNLTPAGERFFVRAQHAMEEIRRGYEEAGQWDGRMTGSVTVAMSGAMILSLLPPVYAAFRRDCPDVRLNLVEGLFPAVERRMREGQLDFYIGPRPEQGLSSAYTVQLLFRNQRLILARRDHPLAHVTTVEALLDADWTAVGLRQRVEEEFEEQFAALGLRSPRLKTVTESMLGLVLLLTTSDAMALLPKQWVETATFSNLLAPIQVKEQLEAPDMVEVQRTGLPLTPAAERLAVLLRRAAGHQVIPEQGIVVD